MLAGINGNTYSARILARAIHSPEIHFSLAASSKCYLFDSIFCYRPEYMAAYKSSNIFYYFQQFRDERTGHRHRLWNARERFNFRNEDGKSLTVCLAIYFPHKFLLS